jgi:hypothetical protein
MASCLLLCALGLFAQQPDQHNRLTPQERSSGWKLLFDGRSSSGWRSLTSPEFPAACWAVEDGSLRTIAGSGSDPWVDLVTVESFENFELTLDWKIGSGANSGIKYLIQDAWFGDMAGARRGPKALGLEFQIVDDQRDPEALKNAAQATGALYYLLPPDHNAAVTVETWNSARVLVQGNRVEHWLNGRKVLQFDLNSARLRVALDNAIASGARPATMAGLKASASRSKRVTPIALQHMSGTVWFRNIKIHELNP